MSERRDGGVERALESLAANSSRRGFLARVGAAGTALTAGGLVAKAVRPGEADAYHFCGHIFTTGSCPHPSGLPRIDSHGLAVRSSDGKPIDNLGRVVNKRGVAVDDHGNPKRDTDGHPLPPAPRTQVCQHQTAVKHNINTTIDGGWYRCCGGQVRKLVDCCSDSSRRINGDAALEGYCYQGRKVFCVMYFQTKVPC